MAGGSPTKSKNARKREKAKAKAKAAAGLGLADMQSGLPERPVAMDSEPAAAQEPPGMSPQSSRENGMVPGPQPQVCA